MSSTALSNQAQIRYILEWYSESSELQRDDFFKVLIKTLEMVNGLLSSSIENLGINSNRPPSLFECRIKLLREWSLNWTEQEKETLISSLKNLDPKFAEKYDQRSGISAPVADAAGDNEPLNEC